MPGMTYYQAALEVLGAAGRPLSTREIADLSVEQQLVVPRGKTPNATMSAALYARDG